MPDSEVARIVAVVPSWSGARSSSTSISTTAWLESLSSMLGDRADGPPAHLHLVALDQLAGVLEDGLDPVAAVAGEHQQGDEHDRGGDPGERGKACQDGPALGLGSYLRCTGSGLVVQAGDRPAPLRGGSIPVWALPARRLKDYSIPHGLRASSCIVGAHRALALKLVAPLQT